MSEPFAAACAALWASLGLRPPAAAGRARELTVEDHVVTLVPSPDERAILVTARCGPLSADLPARLGQLRDLLRNNLGLVVTNDAVLRLDPEAAPQGAAVVEALCPFGPDIVPRLTKTIENVLQLLDIQGATLKDAGAQRAALAASVPVASDESLIFRL